MTLVNAVRAIRDGRLDEPIPEIEGDPEATAMLRDLAGHLSRVTSEVRRILDEIAVQGRLGGQAMVPGATGVWSELIVDINQLAIRVTDQIRDLTQTVIARQRAVPRSATAPAAGEIQQLMDAVNAFADSRAGRDQLAADVGEITGRIQANIENLEERVEERTEEIRHLLDARTQFFAALSHEFRTPLAVILRQADALIAAPTGDADATVYSAGVIRSSGEELLAMVNDVLEVARAETNQLDLNVEPFDFADLVRELEPTFGALAASGGIAFQLAMEADQLDLDGDRRRLRQVLLNLVGNAIKYTPEGGRVSIDVRHGTSVVRVTVADNGVGIPFEARRRIFEPFYTVPGVVPQRGEPSSGLGLAIAKRIVSAHRGDLYCMSDDAGTSFVMIIPRRRVNG